MRKEINIANRNASISTSSRNSNETRNLIHQVENRLDWFFQDLNELINNQPSQI